MQHQQANEQQPKQWPASSVVNRSVARLKFNKKNSRTHSPQQIEQIMAAIREWGWTSPLLIDETGTLIAGEGRLRAAKALGLEKVPCMVAKKWTDEQKRAYLIADNQLALNAGWDMQVLGLELAELGDLGFDTGTIGFSDAELANIFMDGEPETDPDTEWQGMPEYENENINSHRRLIVHFVDEAALEEFQKLLGITVSDTAKFAWYPKQPREDLTTKVCE